MPKVSTDTIVSTYANLMPGGRNGVSQLKPMILAD
jgi:hypothetical protein